MCPLIAVRTQRTLTDVNDLFGFGTAIFQISTSTLPVIACGNYNPINHKTVGANSCDLPGRFRPLKPSSMIKCGTNAVE